MTANTCDGVRASQKQPDLSHSLGAHSHIAEDELINQHLEFAMVTAMAGQVHRACWQHRQRASHPSGEDETGPEP